MPALNGVRVALLEARLGHELADLVRALGGAPYPVAAVREAPRLDGVPAFIDALAHGRLAVVVFLTGTGVLTLLREAERLGRLDDAIAGLRRATIVCRGPKPSAVLRRYSVAVQVSAAAPYTTAELLDVLRGVAIVNGRVALVHYGERNAVVAEALVERGAELDELCVYEWQMPADVGPLRTLVHELVEGRVDAIAFTSQIQCRHLFAVAAELGRARELADTLNASTVVAAVGPVCAAALKAYGVVPDVLPAQPRARPMLAALAEYFELIRDPAR